jgi:hypothetical protein
MSTVNKAWPPCSKIAKASVLTGSNASLSHINECHARHPVTAIVFASLPLILKTPSTAC